MNGRADESDALEETVVLLKALADATRLKLVGLLSTKPHTVEDLAREVGVRMPTVSHHLRKLEAVGLLRMRPEGTRHWYSLDEDVLHAKAKALLGDGELTRHAADATERSWEERVLSSYLVDGRITEIPAQRKKRSVLLAFIATRFEVGTSYTEAEVNAIIGQLHEDFATLRRELIGAKLLARDGEGRRYWKL